MKFFIDNCLPPRYATILAALEHGDVVSLREQYPTNTADETWIREIGEKGWILISRDRNQLRIPRERAALRDAGVVAFYLAKAFDNHVFDEQVWRVVKAWPTITRVASTSKRGSIYLVTINGKVQDFE